VTGDQPRPYIAVVGAGDCSDDDPIATRAETVGRLVVEAGGVVVCGGLGGVMAAACRGAKSVGRPDVATVGVLPGTDRRDANEWVDVALPTGLGEARNVLVVRAADAVIAIGGEYGTLSELAFALKTGAPVVGLGTWQLARGGSPVDAFVEAGSAEEAVRLALERVRR
jgi:uncharacterized protein (TIGR00725 family)